MYVHIYNASGFVALAHTVLARTYRAAAPLQLCIMHAGDHRHSPGVWSAQDIASYVATVVCECIAS